MKILRKGTHIKVDELYYVKCMKCTTELEVLYSEFKDCAVGLGRIKCPVCGILIYSDDKNVQFEKNIYEKIKKGE